MDNATFWRIIEDARLESDRDAERHVDLVVEALSRLPKSETVAFHAFLDELLAHSYTSELWGAAYVINGGCSDDCFDAFRGWLIAQGQTVFEAALVDPETLADVPQAEEGAVELEDMPRVAHLAYETRTGRELPLRERAPRELTGQPWNEGNLDGLYPRLAAKHGRSAA